MAKVFLLTGLSGAGKTTLANAVYERMKSSQKCVFLDGDILRKGINSDLGFSPADRAENVRRCGEIAKLLCEQDITVLLALIAPYEHLRANLENIVGKENLRIVHIACPVNVCIERDPKNNYKRALSGEVKNYTGVGDCYEPPVAPHLTIHTDLYDAEQCIDRLHNFISAQLSQAPAILRYT